MTTFKSAKRLNNHDFWTGYLAYLAQNGQRSNRSPNQDSVLTFPLSTRAGNDFRLQVSRGVRGENAIGIYLYLRSPLARAASGRLILRRIQIDKQFNEPLDWSMMAQGLVGFTLRSDPDDRKKWPEYFKWLTERGARLDAGFASEISKAREQEEGKQC